MIRLQKKSKTGKLGLNWQFISNQSVNLFITGFSIAYFLFFLRGFAANMSNIPYWDEWDVRIDWLTHFQNSGPSQLFALHNEHRPTISYLSYLINYYLFQGNTASLYVFNFFLISGIILLLLNNGLSKKNHLDNTGKFFLALLVLSAMVSLVGNENLYWALESVFYSVLLIPMIAFHFMQKWREDFNYWKRCLVTAISAASSLTMAAGQLTPFITGLFFLFILRMKRTACINFLIGLLIVFLYNLNNNSDTNTFEFALKHPISVIVYLVKFYISPAYIGSNQSIPIAILWGLLLIYLTKLFLMNSVKLRYLNVFYSGTIIFVVINSVIIAIGRVEFGTSQAYSSRYTIYSLLYFLIVAIGSLNSNLDKLAESKLKNRRIIICSLFFLFLTTSSLQIGASKPRLDLSANQAFAQFLLKKQVNDKTVSAIYPNTERALFVSKPYIFTSKFNFSNKIFDPPSLQDLEKYASTMNTCNSFLDSSRFPTGSGKGQILSGWITNGDARQRIGKIYLFGSSQNLVGLGYVGLHRPDVARAFSILDEYSGFNAYIFDKYSKELKVKVYFVTGNCVADMTVPKNIDENPNL